MSNTYFIIGRVPLFSIGQKHAIRFSRRHHSLINLAVITHSFV